MVADTIASETLINKSLERVEELLSATYTQHQLETAVNAMCMHVINAGGKRIRPRLAVMSALALPHYNEELHYEKICHIAAAFEMLHTATLVHDDVIDKASMRRGQPTLNDTSGNHAAVLAGDYLFTRCFDLIAYPEEFGVIKALNRTLSELVVGELYQLENEGNSNISYETYYRTIYAKTGVLFELSASAPAIIIKEDSALEAPLREYGRQLGIAFQIKDDMLDYSADAEALGKDPGTDLSDGRITLPVLIALNRSNEQEREQLLEDIKEANLEAVKAAIARTNAMQECERQSQEACDKAIACLDVLEDSPYKQGLIAVCKKAVARNS